MFKYQTLSIWIHLECGDNSEYVQLKLKLLEIGGK